MITIAGKFFNKAKWHKFRSKELYMRRDKVGDEIKAKTPPNGAKDIACDLLHSSHQANAMVDLGEELK